MNVERDELNDYIKDLEDKLEIMKDIKTLRKALIEGIREILSEKLPLDGNVHENETLTTFTFDIKTNEYKFEIKIESEIKRIVEV